MTVALRALLAEAQEALGSQSPLAGTEARRILEDVTGLEGAELVAELDRPATQREVARLDDLVRRRREGEPLQYVLSGWGFRTLDLYLDGRVLIPRPETEVVVSHALGELQRVLEARGEPSVRVVDLGAGSGAIALSIAVEQVRAEVWATELSPDALDVARANLAGIGRPGRRVRLLEGDWFAPLPAELEGAVDVVVANPPYVAATETLPAEVAAWEPRGALVSGPTGLESYERIVPAARRWLRPGGALVLEIGATQAEAVVALAGAAGFGEVEVHRDLAGRDRVVVAR